MILVTCKICLKQVPQDFAHRHHERPQAAGGQDEDEVDLCTQCHTNLHAVASMLMGKRASLAEDTVNAYYQDYGARKRCFELSKLVVEWMVAKKDGQLTKDPNEIVELTIELPVKVKSALAILAKSVKHQDSNRKAGMASLGSQIVCDYIYKQFPDLRAGNKPKINESQNEEIIKTSNQISASRSPMRKFKK